MNTSPELQPQLPKTPEVIKQEAFSETLRSFFFFINQEAPTINTFKFGEREFPVDTPAGGVKATGQLYALMAKNVYDNVIRQNQK